MKSIDLGGGMSLTHIHAKKFNTVVVSLFIRQPLRLETVSVTALIAQLVMRGSRKFPTMNLIKRETERLFGSLFDVQIVKKGENQLLQFYLEMPVVSDVSLLDEGLAFLSDVVLNPALEDGGFKADYFKTEVESLRQGILSRSNNPAEYAKLRCLEEMCKEEPFGLSADGYVEQLGVVSRFAAAEHYQKLLKTAPIDFFIIGDVSEAEARNKLTEYFQTERQPAIDIHTISNSKAPEPPRFVSERRGLSQSKLCVGYRCGAADYDALLVMCEMLGGGAGSKLFEIVREREGLCYYINTFVYRAKALMMLQSGIDGENLEKVLALSGKCLNDIADGRFSRLEFENAQKSVVKRLTAMRDYPGALLDFFLAQKLSGDTDDLGDVTARMMAVTLHRVKEAARRTAVDTIFLLK